MKNRAQKIAYLKRELRALEDQKELFKQGLSSISNREMYLKSELDDLGVVSSARKGKMIDPTLRLDIRASITRGSQPLPKQL